MDDNERNLTNAAATEETKEPEGSDEKKAAAAGAGVENEETPGIPAPADDDIIIK